MYIESPYLFYPRWWRGTGASGHSTDSLMHQERATEPTKKKTLLLGD